jgi:Glycosyltransferase sugar-binding region containing DXD motif
MVGVMSPFAEHRLAGAEQDHANAGRDDPMFDSRVVQGLWTGPMTTMERLSISSFLANGHEYHLYTYDEAPDAPAGTVLKSGAEILPASWIFRDSRNSYASFSEFFRYKLLFDRGGWWVDTDLVCVRPLEADSECVLTLEPDMTIATGVIRMPVGSDLMRRAWGECLRLDRSRVTWGDSGPAMLARLVEELGLGEAAVEPAIFYPLDWPEWEKALDPAARIQLDARTNTVHLWNSMWDLAGRDKNAKYPDGCLYEELKRIYLTDATQGP